jgi:hypothetical protein
LASRAYSGAENGQKRGNLVGPFLEQNILPIVVHFSNLLNDAQGWQIPSEKRRALQGIEEMFRVGKGYVRSALPQVRSQNKFRNSGRLLSGHRYAPVYSPHWCMRKFVRRHFQHGKR